MRAVLVMDGTIHKNAVVMEAMSNPVTKAIERELIMNQNRICIQLPSLFE